MTSSPLHRDFADVDVSQKSLFLGNRKFLDLVGSNARLGRNYKSYKRVYLSMTPGRLAHRADASDQVSNLGTGNGHFHPIRSP